jgi:hypothetical protein
MNILLRGSGVYRQVRSLPAVALARSLQAPKAMKCVGTRFVAASLIRLPAAHPAHHAAAVHTLAPSTKRPAPERAWLLASQLSPIIDFSATAVPLKMPARA